MTTDADEFKKYFFDKFTNQFKELLHFSYDNVKSQNVKNDLIKVKDIVDKLNYEKIMNKLSAKQSIHEKLVFLHRNEYKKEHMDKMLHDDKEFILMPSFNLCNILQNISKSKREAFFDLVDKLFLCITSYNQLIESQKSLKEGEIFNPFSGIGLDKVDENMDVSTMFNGVKAEQFSAYEMLMKSMVDQQLDSKMTDYMNNIDETQVNNAAGKIENALNSDKFKSSQSTDVLKGMLSKIKKELVNVGNDKNNSGKQGVEKILNIAQTIAGDMSADIKNSKVSIMDLWDSTAKLAEDSTNSTAFQVLNKIVRSNIEKNMQNENESENK